jgi:hypothetical protein
MTTVSDAVLAAMRVAGGLMRLSYGRVCPCKRAVLAAMIAVAACVFAATDSVSAKVNRCPPRPGDKIIDTEQMNGANTPLDKQLDENRDEEGNVWQLWCVDDSCFGVRYVPAGGQAVWIGKCWFPGGKNRRDKCGPDKQGKRGVKDRFTKLSWKNVPKPGSGTTLDWYYVYDPATNDLKVTKTTGQWSGPYHVTTGRKKCRWHRKWSTTGTEEYYDGTAPDNYDDIPGFLTADTADTALAGSMVLFEPVTKGPSDWMYGMAVPELGGTGTEANPYLGIPAPVLPGDTLTLAAPGLANPYVTGEAAALGWQVTDSGLGFAEYVYQGAGMVLDPGYTIDGFGFESLTAGGWLSWNLDGDGLNDDGQIPEPTTLALMGIGAAMLRIRNSRWLWRGWSRLHNPVIRDHYQHLQQQARPKKVALIACMPRLLIRLNTLMAEPQHA